MLNIVIPMAGRGSRFKDAGYAFPKPLIDIQGKTMIEIVVNNLRPSIDHRFIFIVQKEHYETYDLYNILKNASHNKFEIVVINGITEGAACTVLTAIEYINTDDDLLIANSDQFITTSIDAFIESGQEPQKDGLIMTFSASHPKWSYALVDENDKVLEVAEKKVISDQATVGIYYFKKGKYIKKYFQEQMDKNINYGGELYVTLTYNLLIRDGLQIWAYPTEHVMVFGTPEEVRTFEAWQTILNSPQKIKNHDDLIKSFDYWK